MYIRKVLAVLLSKTGNVLETLNMRAEIVSVSLNFLRNFPARACNSTTNLSRGGPSDGTLPYTIHRNRCAAWESFSAHGQIAYVNRFVLAHRYGGGGGSQLYGQTGGGSQVYGYTGEYPRSHYSRRRSDYDSNF